MTARSPEARAPRGGSSAARLQNASESGSKAAAIPPSSREYELPGVHTCAAKVPAPADWQGAQRACDRVARENARNIGEGYSPIIGNDCLATSKGVWAIHIASGKQSVEPGLSPGVEIAVTNGKWQLIHEGTSGRQSGPNQEFHAQAMGAGGMTQSVSIRLASDYDGDGEVEVLAVIDTMTHVGTVSREAQLFAHKGGRVVALKSSGAIMDLDDVDCDGLLDLKVAGPCDCVSDGLILPPASCSLLWQVEHAIRGGHFSVDDEIAKKHAVQCPAPEGH